MNHITDLDTITTHSKEKEGDNFVDLLFKSLDRNSETLDVTSEVSPSAAIESSFLPEIDQSEIEYAPQREEGKKSEKHKLLIFNFYIVTNCCLPQSYPTDQNLKLTCLSSPKNQIMQCTNLDTCWTCHHQLQSCLRKMKKVKPIVFRKMNLNLVCIMLRKKPWLSKC